LGKRYALSKRDRRGLNELLKKFFGVELIGKDDLVEVYEEKGLPRIILLNGEPFLIMYDDKPIPHLKYLLKHGVPKLPMLIVDRGAIKPLLRGADLMAPGVRRVVGEFSSGDIVCVGDEDYGKPFMIGLALIDSKDLVEGVVRRGRVVKNIHRIGDKFWKLF
jgi:PUA-domain protein